MFLNWGGGRRAWRKVKHARGEHATFTQKGPSCDSNPNTVPPCSPELIFCILASIGVKALIILGALKGKNSLDSRLLMWNWKISIISVHFIFLFSACWLYIFIHFQYIFFSVSLKKNKCNFSSYLLSFVFRFDEEVWNLGSSTMNVTGPTETHNPHRGMTHTRTTHVQPAGELKRNATHQKIQ